MTEIRFYHLQRTALEAALPPMLEKTLERGQRAVVMAGSEERVEALTDASLDLRASAAFCRTAARATAMPTRSRSG